MLQAAVPPLNVPTTRCDVGCQMPEPEEPGTASLWQKTIDEFQSDLKQMVTLVEDPSTDLYAKIPHGDGQTILREALLIADHNAYHLGALAVMSRIVKSL